MKPIVRRRWIRHKKKGDDRQGRLKGLLRGLVLQPEVEVGADHRWADQSDRSSREEIMKDLGRGIFITGFIGGNSNPTTGDASIGIIGQLFEGGKPVQAISEMNISDNHLKLWNKLIEVANDPYPYSSLRFPSMVFKDIVVSGL